LLRPNMPDDRPSEPSPVEVVLPRTAAELDENVFGVGDRGADVVSKNGEVNWGGDDEPTACSGGNLYVDDGMPGARISGA
jgi:hypothetical protein